MEGKKKQSLFKQRLKEAKESQNNLISQQQSNSKGFPQIIKIDTTLSQQNSKQKTHKNVNKEQGFLNHLKTQMYIDQNEYDTISKSNDKYLSGLSEQQLTRMKAQLMKQLSPSLLSKLNIQSHQQSTNNMTQPNKDYNKKVNPISQSNEFQTQPPPQQMKVQQNPFITKYKLRMQNIQLLDDLTFNIKSNLISKQPRSQQNPKLIQINKMLYSDNNQTIVVGIKLFKQILQQIRTIKWEYDMTIINGYYYHRKILIAYIYQKFIKQIWKQKYLYSKSITLKGECFEGIVDYINTQGQIEENILVDIINYQQKIKTISAINTSYSEQTNKLIQGLGIQIRVKDKQLNSFFQNYDKIDLINILPCSNKQISIFTICEKLLLESLHLQFSPQILNINKINIFSNQSTIPIMFITIQYLKFKQMYSIQSIINLILFSIYLITKQNWSQLTQLILSSNQTIKYQLLYIYKHINTIQYIQYLSTLSEIQIHQNSSLQKVLFLLNIQQYLYTQWPQNQIQLINQSITSITNFDNTIEYSMLFYELTLLFTNQKQSYFQLNQSNLNNTIEEIVNRMNPLYLQLIMGIESIKRLVQSYIYNSYGNVIFSKVLLFLSSSIMKEDKQNHIISEVYYRYPGILMEAGKQKLYGRKEIYDFNKRSTKIKGDLEKVKEMVEEDRQNNFYNMLIGNEQG